VLIQQADCIGLCTPRQYWQFVHTHIISVVLFYIKQVWSWCRLSDYTDNIPHIFTTFSCAFLVDLMLQVCTSVTLYGLAFCLWSYSSHCNCKTIPRRKLSCWCFLLVSGTTCDGVPSYSSEQFRYLSFPMVCYFNRNCIILIECTSLTCISWTKISVFFNFWKNVVNNTILPPPKYALPKKHLWLLNLISCP
jgi:hypothetical protein